MNDNAAEPREQKCIVNNLTCQQLILICRYYAVDPWLCFMPMHLLNLLTPPI